MVTLTPHTLVRLKAINGLTSTLPLPDWATSMLNETPYVIIRRGAQADRIPVGFVAIKSLNALLPLYLPHNWQKPLPHKRPYHFYPSWMLHVPNYQHFKSSNLYDHFWKDTIGESVGACNLSWLRA